MFQTSSKEQTTTIMSRDVCMQALSQLNNMAWLFIVLCRSMFYAVTQGFLYWHMENIGRSKYDKLMNKPYNDELSHL